MIVKLYFFKENHRVLDINMILNFFQYYDDCLKYESNDMEFRIKYYNENMKNAADFILSNKSMIRDIHKINPRYLDTDFRVEIPALKNDYNAERIFEIIISLCEKFDFMIYNDLFQDVSSCSMELLKSVFERYKIVEKKIMNIHEYLFIEPTLLYEIAKYKDQRLRLIQDYSEKEDIVVPEPKYLYDRQANCFVYALEWQEGEKIIFPPLLDLIVYFKNAKIYLIPFSLIYEHLGKYMTPVPGFSTKAFLLGKRGVHESKKVMKKLIEYDEKRDLDLVSFEKLIEK